MIKKIIFIFISWFCYKNDLCEIYLYGNKLFISRLNYMQYFETWELYVFENLVLCKVLNLSKMIRKVDILQYIRILIVIFLYLC